MDLIDHLRQLVDLQEGVIPGTFKLLATRSWEHGEVFIYQYQVRHICFPQEARILDMFCTSISRYDEKGQLVGFGGGGRDAINVDLLTDQLIDISAGSGGYHIDYGHCACAVGRVISPEVAAVEVLFNNGKVLRDLASDGYVALVADQATGAVHARILNAKGETMQLLDLK
jgi:hypothetical protein